MKKILMVLFMVMLVFTLSACQTMHGFGKDVEHAGGWVQEKAN